MHNFTKIGVTGFVLLAASSLSAYDYSDSSPSQGTYTRGRGYQAGYQQNYSSDSQIGYADSQGQQSYSQSYPQGNPSGSYSAMPNSSTQGYYNQQFPADQSQSSVNVYGGGYGGEVQYDRNPRAYDQNRPQNSYDQQGRQMNQQRNQMDQRGQMNQHREGERRSFLSDATMQSRDPNMAVDNSNDAAYKVRRALQSDTSLSIGARNIQVSVNSDNELMLTGTVKDDAEKRKVEIIAKKASGIQDVINKLSSY